MKKNAFTLIEMLSVIVILVLISLIAIFSIKKIVDDSSEDVYNVQLTTILDASRIYAMKNSSTFSNNTQITLCDLKRAGLLENEFINPKTDTKFSDNLIIDISKNEDKTFSFNFDGKTEMENYVCNLNGFGVTLIGDSPYYASLNSTISIPSVNVTDINGKELYKDIDYQLDVNYGNLVSGTYSETGQFYVTYKITSISNENETTSITRTVIVEDKTSPVLTVNGQNLSFEERILVGTTYNVNNCSVYDNSRELLTCKIIDNYSKNANTPGTYNVTYSAVDSSGNSNTLVVTIVVLAKNKSLLGTVKVSSTAWTNDYITLTIQPLYKKYSCNNLEVTYDNGAIWHTYNSSEPHKYNATGNGIYNLGIRYAAQCGMTEEVADMFTYEVKNIDKTAPTFYIDTGTPENPVLVSKATLNVTVGDGVNLYEEEKVKTIDEKTIRQKYYYANGTVTLNNPSGATDIGSGVSKYTILVNDVDSGIETTLTTTDGSLKKYDIKLIAEDFAGNTSEPVYVATIIVDRDKPKCEFVKCSTANECVTKNPIWGDNVTYVFGNQVRVQLTEAEFQLINFKLNCTDRYFLDENDELINYNISLSKFKAPNEYGSNPSVLAYRDNNSVTSLCDESAEICEKTYSYTIGLNVGKAMVFNDEFYLRILADAVQDKAGNLNTYNDSMQITKVFP